MNHALDGASDFGFDTQKAERNPDVIALRPILSDETSRHNLQIALT
jgi:hypothetical protein